MITNKNTKNNYIFNKMNSTAAALRERGLAVLKLSCFQRPSIIGRNDFFVRYGKQEREAVACFDFLDQMTSSINLTSSTDEFTSKSILENQESQDSGKAISHKSMIERCANKDEEELDSDSTAKITFSDSCAVSFSGSDLSFDS